MSSTRWSFAVMLVAAALMQSCSKEKPADTAMTDTAASGAGTAMSAPDTAMSTPAAAVAEEKGVMVGGAMMVPSKNIVENASNANNVTTLVSAVKAAGLVETLSGPGPFTVFAPTDDAFNKLPAGTVDNLVKPENKEKLTKILTYHVVPGKMMAADLTDGQKLKTVNGDELTVTVKDGSVMINGAKVATADVVSSNGVTHVIDAVLMPPSK